MKVIDEDKNKAMTILRQLYHEGQEIQKGYENESYLHISESRAKTWLQKARHIIRGVFYNQKFYADFEAAIQEAYSSFSDSMNYHDALCFAIGHIEALGIMMKNGYVKDQYCGVDNSASRKVFVAMSFDPVLEDNYNVGIKPALESLGFSPIRADKQHHNDKIDTKICEWIAESRFVVADYTGHRTGVYYEAGFAKGLGLPVVQVCNARDFDKLHFDVKTINTINFETPSKLNVILKEHVLETIGRYDIAPKQAMSCESDAFPF